MGNSNFKYSKRKMTDDSGSDFGNGSPENS